jgi:hypothetical protein
MNERIKELAEQAGFFREFALSGIWLADDEELERFAELVRQDEREACAKLCDDWGHDLVEGNYAAKTIRARGKE